MGHAYTPGLKVTRRTRHRCKRLLPIPGDVPVSEGEQVHAQQVVARTSMPGEVIPINVANLLSVPPGEVPESMLKKEGDQVEVGEVIARSKGIFGFFKSECRSKSAGTIESISHVTGQVILRGDPVVVEVKAYLQGEVVQVIPKEGVVIEAEVSYIQGIFGVGGEAYGPIRIACKDHTQELTSELITPDMRGAVVVGGARAHHDALKKAVQVGAAAVVTGGLDDQDLKNFLGYDLGVAITGSENLGITLIITEGFGDIAMAERTYNLLHERQGDYASVNGATQIRAGVMRPEILIPLSEAEIQNEQPTPELESALEVGVPVRIIRDPYFGLIGTIESLPSEPQVLGSGSKARVLQVKFESGETVTVPRANIELIEK